MKTREREQARAMRAKEGRSIKEIARLVDVAPSTVSLWVRDIELCQPISTWPFVIETPPTTILVDDYVASSIGEPVRPLPTRRSSRASMARFRSWPIFDRPEWIDMRDASEGGAIDQGDRSSGRRSSVNCELVGQRHRVVSRSALGPS